MNYVVLLSFTLLLVLLKLHASFCTAHLQPGKYHVDVVLYIDNRHDIYLLTSHDMKKKNPYI